MMGLKSLTRILLCLFIGSQSIFGFEEEKAKPRLMLAKDCSLCHSNSSRATAMRDSKNRPIAPYDLWQASAMANSARDPFWRAQVSIEVLNTPSKKRDIESKCLRCHSPLASVAAKAHGLNFGMKDLLTKGTELNALALEGVSCTVCHQISEDNLGDEESYNGNFKLNTEAKIFGPHRDLFSHPMENHTGFTPTYGSHIQKSELCATCHTLTTQALRPDGTSTGHGIVEQGPYLEWKNSLFSNKSGKSCQDCHVPTKDEDGNLIKTRIVRNPGGRNFPPTSNRSPYGRHIFVGGNTLLPRLLSRFSEELQVTATSQQLKKIENETRKFLSSQSARVELGISSVSEGRLYIPVKVVNLSGHKLPTAYPSRRLWLKVTVTDSKSKVLLSSGDYDGEGRLLGHDQKPLPNEISGGAVYPHQLRISSSEQVQVYEAVMADVEGKPTYQLLRGASYKKDNRLLPQGWKGEDRRLRPIGIGKDSNFKAGEDFTEYAISIDQISWPLTIEASLHFQTLGVRYADEMFKFETKEVRTFRRMFQAVGSRTEVLSQVKKTLNKPGD